MFKATLFSFSFLGYLFFSLLFPEGVNVTTKFPESANPGDEFVYEITIDKPGLMGFAKVQQELPEGFTATAVETKSATFSSIGGKVKFIWMALPPEDQFTVSYKIKVDESMTPGNKEITGKFSFLVDNAKDSRDIPLSSILIGGDLPVASSETAVDSETSNSTESVADVILGASEDASSATENAVNNTTDAVGGAAETATTALTNTTNTDLNIDASASGESSAVVDGEKVVLKRSIETINEAEGKYKVIYDVTNNGLTGFAKLQDVIPGETMGYEEQAHSAVYSFVNRKSKFVWMSFPEDKQFQVSYMAVVKDAAGLEELKNTAGEFSYLDNNETKRIAVSNMAGSSGETASNNLAVNDATEANNNTDVEVPVNNLSDNTTNATAANDNQQADASMTETSPEETIETSSNSGIASASKNTVDQISSTNQGLGYKVQIMANKRTLSNVPAYFKKIYKYTETAISTENHEGWIKYTIDWYSEYKSARDRRNQVTAGYNFPGPFVTAYNNGKRITVQEALMISKQNWIP